MVLGYGTKTEVKNSSQGFSQRNGKDGGTLTELRKTVMESVGSRRVEFRESIRIGDITGE